MDELIRLRQIIEAAFGPAIVIGTADAPIVQLQGNPTLTAEQQTTLADLLVFWRSGITGITFAEWQALDAAMADDRAFRQQTRAQFLAKTQAQQARELFDLGTAHSKMIRALTRDKR